MGTFSTGVAPPYTGVRVDGDTTGRIMQGMLGQEHPDKHQKPGHNNIFSADAE